MPAKPPTMNLPEQTARREFLKQAGKSAATAPAIALLLAASSKAASAQPVYGSPDFAGDESIDS